MQQRRDASHDPRRAAAASAPLIAHTMHGRESPHLSRLLRRGCAGTRGRGCDTARLGRCVKWSGARVPASLDPRAFRSRASSRPQSDSKRILLLAALTLIACFEAKCDAPARVTKGALATAVALEVLAHDARYPSEGASRRARVDGRGVQCGDSEWMRAVTRCVHPCDSESACAQRHAYNTAHRVTRCVSAA